MVIDRALGATAAVVANLLQQGRQPCDDLRLLSVKVLCFSKVIAEVIKLACRFSSGWCGSLVIVITAQTGDEFPWPFSDGKRTL